MFHVKHPGARVPPVRASASRSPAPPAPVASRAAPPTGWAPACAHAPSAISRLPRVCTPLCPPPLQRRRIALFPDVSRETPRASAPSIARPVPAFRFLVRMFHVKHSSRSRTACPGRVRARRAPRDGDKASNSEEGALLASLRPGAMRKKGFRRVRSPAQNFRIRWFLAMGSRFRRQADLGEAWAGGIPQRNRRGKGRPRGQLLLA